MSHDNKMLSKLLEEIDEETMQFQLQGVNTTNGAKHEFTTKPAKIIIKNATPEQVQKSYIDYVWKEGGGWGKPTVLRHGAMDTPNHGEGLIRDPGYGLKEKVSRVVPGKHVEYSIPRGLPLTSHHVFVYFEALPDGTGTEISWVMHYTPSFMGRGWFGLYIEYYMFPFFLRNLKKHMEGK